MNSMNERKTTLFLFGGTLLAALALSTTATWAAADPLDEANQSVNRAVLALKGLEGSAQAEDAHRKKAIVLLMRAQGEILKAKKAASDPSAR
jgi:hypothetical protein